LPDEEGLWVEPVSAVPVTALESLIAQGWIERNETVVCILSGAGFKDSSLAMEEAESFNGQPPVPFDAEPS